LDLNTSRDIELITKSPRAIIEFLIILIICASVLIFFLFYDKKNIITATLILFGVAIARLYPCFSSISQFINTLSTNISSYKLIENEIKSINTNEVNFNKNLYSEKKFNFKNKIEFKNVSFKFEEEKIKPLKNINFTIKKNQTICITGASGSGKTTLLQILLGFLNPTAGEVKIDNINLKKIKNAWQKKIGYVPQDIYLLDENIASNIALGVSKNKINFKKIKRILKIVNLKKYIKNIKNNKSKKINYENSNISGGEKQRIALARALYNDPDILIFDEITSALDSITSAKIMKEFLRIKRNKTIIIVTHDTSISKLCQKNFTLSDGFIS
jgi:ABC-type multidrug transport system fused ATPase/permease subunit